MPPFGKAEVLTVIYAHRLHSARKGRPTARRRASDRALDLKHAPLREPDEYDECINKWRMSLEKTAAN